MKTVCVGLTGGIASGKTTVSNLFAQQGCEMIDADQVAIEITTASGLKLETLRQQVGDWAFNEQGLFDRALVRQKIFSNTTYRHHLEQVLHPMIYDVIAHRLEQSVAKITLVEIPLLMENYAKWKPLFSRILVVDCPLPLQILRIAQRDLKNDGEDIIASQITREERLKFADDVINNEGTLQHLSQAVRELMKKYQSFL